MASLEREFHRSFRGPGVNDEDAWRLVYDADAADVMVRHSWRGARDSGVEDFALDEFLKRRDAASDALLALMFDTETAAA